jgi:addiction module HigA family antidote
MAMEMFNPPHPGEIVREDCMVPSGLSVTEAAMRLGVSRQTVSELINGRNGISAEMALKLEKAGWGDALSWLRNQVSYDLWQARNREEAPARKVRFKVRVHRTTVKSSAAGEDIVEAVAAATKRAARKAAARKAALKKAREAASTKRGTPAKRRA